MGIVGDGRIFDLGDIKMIEVVEGKLDPQIEEAINDISDSFKIIKNLGDVTIYDTKELIKFHKLRITFCLKALLKVVK